MTESTALRPVLPPRNGSSFVIAVTLLFSLIEPVARNALVRNVGPAVRNASR